MASDYAKRLRPYENKGRLGLEPDWDRLSDIRRKVQQLAKWFRAAHGQIVVHTGAGLSTAAGIRDFRGPHGVWSTSLAPKKDQAKPATRTATVWKDLPSKDAGVCDGGDDPRSAPLPPDARLELAAPTLSHWALTELVHRGYICRVVTQNIDGLHLRSGLERHRLSELHGNIFAEQCERCGRVVLNDVVVPTVGCRRTGRYCVHCQWQGHRAALRDLLLDWEDPLPAADLMAATEDSRDAQLCLVIGSSMQMLPAATLPCLCLRNPKARLVIVNASWTARDKLAHLVIRAPADMVLALLLYELAIVPSSVEEGIVWRRQLALGVRWSHSGCMDGPAVDVCVWNGRGEAPGVYLSTEASKTLDVAPEQEPWMPERAQTLWLPQCGRLVPQAEQVANWKALTLDHQGCVSFTLACFGFRQVTEHCFCTAGSVKVRLGFTMTDGAFRPVPKMADGWYLVTVPYAGWLVFHIRAYVEHLLKVLSSAWVERERIQLPAALIFYRETERRRCLCILCGTQVAVQMRQRHLERHHGRELESS